MQSPRQSLLFWPATCPHWLIPLCATIFRSISIFYNSSGQVLIWCVLQEIDSTVGIMRDNINKVSERGERLDSLQDKTDNLAVSAQGFRRGANRVRKQMWWKDMKMRMCIIVGIIILLIVIIVPSGSYPDGNLIFSALS